MNFFRPCPIFLGTALFFAATTSTAFANIPWSPRIVCSGPSGEAVMDDYIFTYYGLPVFQQQFVIRSPEINTWLHSQGVVAAEIAQNFPHELILNLNRPQSAGKELVSAHYESSLGAFNYALEIDLPEVAFKVFSRETGAEQAAWIFRECRRVR